MLLADFGADVIKIERPGVGDLCRHWPPFKDGHSAYYSFLNRGKKSITVNARTEEGTDIIKKLVSQADVVCENFKVGNMDRLGLGYDELQKINPKLIYGSISGFGITGPMKDIPAYDLMLQAMSGLADLTGTEGGVPTKVGPAIGDHFSGVYLAMAICLALIYREKTGNGQRAEISILDTLFSALESAPISYSITGKTPSRIGNAGLNDAPYDTFQTVDGLINIGITNDQEWQVFCETIERKDLLDMPAYNNANSRLKNYAPELKSIISDFFREKTGKEIEEKFRAANLACSRILSMKEVINLDHIKEREMLIDVEDSQIGHIKMPGISIKLNSTPGRVSFGSQALGESTDSILLEAGFTKREIEKFRFNKIV